MSTLDTDDELTRTPPTLEGYRRLRSAAGLSPKSAGQGAGALADLLSQVHAVAPDGAYVTLLADAPGRRLYESFGFVETAPESLGMRLAR